MATKYNEIVELRGGKAAYNITNEENEEWGSFISNRQFNEVLATVIKSVRGKDIDYHKSFWINGTYGTGKSHAVAVISHLLCDPVEGIRDWVNKEYQNKKFDSIRQSIYKLRETKRLLNVNVYGLSAMTHAEDFARVIQKAVTEALKKHNIEISVHTDFETYINHIRKNPEIWNHLIKTHTKLSSIVANNEELAKNLEKNDLGTFHIVVDTLRDAKLDIVLENSNIAQWLFEVQEKLCDDKTYNGLLIIWDEFTDVMTDAIGVPVLKKLQEVAEKFMKEESNSYIFLISHPSAFNNLDSEVLKQTNGRYHCMKYNMEPVSAFKIMSRKFNIIDQDTYRKKTQRFYHDNIDLINIYTSTSNNPEETRLDLFNMFPLHPGTANLATHYATVVGSSSRSVFEFLGQNDSIREFLDSEERYLNRDTITADYLWDYVLKVFQDDVTNYGAITERYNSRVRQVSNEGEAYLAIFKGVLLLNAFNNISGENNNGLVTPSEDNIRALFAGTRYAQDIDDVLQWFNTEGIIQRAPGGLFSVQFSALPSGEIEEHKNRMRNEQFRYTSQILKFSDVARNAFGKMMQKVIRPYKFDFFSDVQNESSLRDKIKKAKKDTKDSELFFALLLSRNDTERAILQTFAGKCAEDQVDKDLQNIIFIVFDAVFTDLKYERFIEYQANYACANSHGFADQQKVHIDHAMSMVKEWMDKVQRDNAEVYINGKEQQTISVMHLSSTINEEITPIIFPYSADNCELLRQRAPQTFWKQQNSKEIVRTFLFAETKEDVMSMSAQMRPVQYLIQECLDDNMEWKDTARREHPFKAVYDKVQDIIKHADKNSVFNFDVKFSLLTRPPYGLYSSFGAMAMMAYALRPWADKIFDMQGKPRDKNALVDDIVDLFKVWDDKKSNNKLNFKFQTPEEGKLCKELISLFKLNSKGNEYSDVTSLKDARYAIIGDFSKNKGCPLWSVKYAMGIDFNESSLPVITDDEKKLIDNIFTICTKTELRNPALLRETLDLISECQYEMRNILNSPAIFSRGFKNYLMQIDYTCIGLNDIDEVKNFITQQLSSTVGYWTEEEVEKCALQWNNSKKPLVKPSIIPPNPPNAISPNPPIDPVDPDIVVQKRQKAKEKIAKITLADARTLLNQLCEEGNEWILDKINN
jgi:hypothetical protein